MITAARISKRPRFATVPKLWPAGTIVCLATGPSLTRADVEYVHGKADAVIAVNDAYRWAPWADVLYACDQKWWRWHKGAPDFLGLKYTLQPEAAAFHRVQVLRQTGTDGLDLNPTGLRTGKNSGYQAINLAVHLGARRIVLLGYDMRGDKTSGDHCFGRHPDGSRPPFALCLPKFKTLVAPLAAAGVEVINCTRVTALMAFPRQPLEAVFP
jgi:hypothetical protein